MGRYTFQYSYITYLLRIVYPIIFKINVLMYRIRVVSNTRIISVHH